MALTSVSVFVCISDVFIYWIIGELAASLFHCLQLQASNNNNNSNAANVATEADDDNTCCSRDSIYFALPFKADGKRT